MVKKMLLNCTTTLLGIMILQYEEGKLNLNEFKVNTELKKSFLEENLMDVEKPEDKINAQKLIQKLEIIYLKALDNEIFNEENSKNRILI